MNRLSILSIGTDQTALDTASRTHVRLVEYAERCSKFVAVVACAKSEKISDGALEIVGSGGGRIGRFWSAWRVARTYRNYDVVTAQDPFENGIIAYFISRRTGAKLHLQCHTDPFAEGFVRGNFLDRVRSRIARFLLKRADAVRCVSERARVSIERETGAVADVVPIVVPNVVATAPINSPFKKTILLVSRLEAEKGIDIVLNALPDVFSTYPDAGVFIVGDGRLRSQLEQQARHLEISNKFIFVGSIQNTAPYYAAADVFVQASAYEGYGLTLLEAAQACVPIVTTDVGLVGEVLHDGTSCVVVDRKPLSISTAINAFFADPSRAQRIAEEARRSALASVRTPEQYADAIVSGFKRARVAPQAESLMVYCQAMDRSDSALGFFVDWVASIAQKYKKVTVVCLKKGDVSGLPENVEVCSLGKDQGKGKVTYITRALSYAWKKRASYNSVFVHMNEEYPLICGWMWWLLGKRVSMWRNHHSGSWKTRLAGFFCTRVLCTSRFSYTASFPNIRLMPVGINLARFTPSESVERDVKKVLFLARLDRSKGVDVAIKAFAQATKELPQSTFDIVGAPTDSESTYPKELSDLAYELGVGERVKFLGAVANAKTPELYQGASVFVNASSSGMYDKTIFEAMACGCIPVASNENLRGIYDDRFIPQQGNVEQFAQAIETALTLDAQERKKVVDHTISIASENSLTNLVGELKALL